LSAASRISVEKLPDVRAFFLDTGDAASGLKRTAVSAEEEGDRRSAAKRRSSPRRRSLSRAAFVFPVRLRGKDSNLDYLIQSQASYH
jgi:hypothetical protein